MLGLIVCQKRNLLSKHSFVFPEPCSHDLGKREKVSTNCNLSNALNCAQNHLYLQTYSYFDKVKVILHTFKLESAASLKKLGFEITGKLSFFFW